MELRQLTKKVEEVRALGARGVELLCTESHGHDLETERGKVVDQTEVSESSIVVRVWLEGGRRADRVGPVEAIDALVDQALSAAAAAPDDAFEGPVGRLQAVVGGLGIRDRRFEQLEEDDRAEVLTTAERSVRQVDRRLSTSGFRYTERLVARRFANSKEVALEEWSTTFTAEGTVRAPGSGHDVVLSDRIASRSFASIASLPYATVLARRAVALLAGGEPLDPGPVRVLLPSHCTARLMAELGRGFVASNLDGSGGFFLQPSDDPVVDTRLHLVDDGTLSGGLSTRSFDDRGVAPIPLTLLREGLVDGRFIGPTDARRLDVRPTGHQVGDALGPSNLVLKSGTRSVNATLSDLGGSCLQVDELGEGAIDPVTGELDAKVDGIVMAANKPVGAMRGVRLRGDLREVLNRVVEICSDTDRTLNVDAPAIIVDGFVIG